MSALQQLKKFTLDNIPEIDVAVLGALELLENARLPKTSVPFRRPLVVGSGNAEATGRIIFRESDAVFADESNYELALARSLDIDGAVVISASGSKHAAGIVKYLTEKGIETVLFTNNTSAPAAAFLPKEMVRVFPKNREPYTYNTSTYLSMIVADKGEDASAIKDLILESIQPALDVPLNKYKAFTMILPTEFAELKPMLRTKFDELFGPKLIGRIFTPEEMKHAKTVIKDPHELFISFGVPNTRYGEEKNRLYVPLPEVSALPAGRQGYAAALAVTYYTVGQIQRAHPPYFKESIATYCKESSIDFGQPIDPIVD
ncbi:hypothetical protein A2392_00920 [Candidatus Kaiserbacteria bacterium RIFOXYB1_FULL_46_14]|uniref:SIS domain-containing protein n=1 Tax=Candidatus Kaiserbacteria bacterium RIFOXYB1_FULL_46_14 TaxID=1798531 RepID=A0A1F6FJI0_9BACT|nr:MAG: hypothetical protein A2392_00920 [Candidatus Kaiserbacteria bacterium RIFOXYB1_FULL_46_14]